MTKLRKVRNKKNDLVLVKWIDAFHLDQGWMFGTQNEIEFDTTPVWTTGFLLKEDRHGILLSQTWFKEDVANVIGIPRGMIKEIISLGRIDKENKFETSRASCFEPSN